MSKDERLVALIDETASIQCYRVGALVVRAHQRKALASDLDSVMASAEERFGVPRETELHAHRIFHALEHWRPLHPRQRIAVYSDALDVVAEHGEAVFIRGVDRLRHKARYNGRFSEHEAALTFVLEELDRYGEQQGQRVHIFADECRFAASARSWLCRVHRVRHLGLAEQEARAHRSVRVRRLRQVPPDPSD